MASNRRIGKNEDGETITLGVGDRLEIELPESPTTGYLWQLAPIEGVAAEVEDSYVPAGAAPGAGGTRLFVITPRGPGRAELRLALRRSWEPPEKAVERFAVWVVVA
jgi:inhibitor of cysteine peptidase